MCMTILLCLSFLYDIVVISIVLAPQYHFSLVLVLVIHFEIILVSFSSSIPSSQ